MKRARQIYNALMRAFEEGCVPFGYYGPETCRWATPDEMRRFGLEHCPMVHFRRERRSKGHAGLTRGHGGRSSRRNCCLFSMTLKPATGSL